MLKELVEKDCLLSKWNSKNTFMTPQKRQNKIKHQQYFLATKLQVKSLQRSVFLVRLLIFVRNFFERVPLSYRSSGICQHVRPVSEFSSRRIASQHHSSNRFRWSNAVIINHRYRQSHFLKIHLAKFSLYFHYNLFNLIIYTFYNSVLVQPANDFWGEDIFKIRPCMNRLTEKKSSVIFCDTKMLKEILKDFCKDGLVWFFVA